MKRNLAGWLLLAVALIAPLKNVAHAGKKPLAGADVRALFLEDLKDTREKVVSLAQAMPEDKYTWRPAAGVRSVGEVYLHIVNANYMFPKIWGVMPPAGMDWSGKATPDKSKTVMLLNQSFDYLQQSVEKIPDAELSQTRNFFGQQKTVAAILFDIATHTHEHLGQAIAYARMNGVTPPWSAAEAAAEHTQKSK
jgi:uncharacterized damage-inducible protein DinB